MSSGSPFIITQREASNLVRLGNKSDDDRHCFLMQLSFQPVYSDIEMPNFCYRNMPRIINGVPLGAGLMTKDQPNAIKWKYIEGGKKVLTFLSEPMYLEEAEQAKRSLKDRLAKQSQEIFKDITVKATVVLSQCINYDDNFIINDIAVNIQEGLHFRN